MRYVKSSSGSGVTLYLEYQPYDRYNAGFRRVRVSGADEIECLTKIADRLSVAVYPEDIEDDDMSVDEIIHAIWKSNGDGNDFIIFLKNETTGEVYIEEDIEVEEW